MANARNQGLTSVVAVAGGFSCARSAGPLGWLDHGDPNITTLLGTTPGLLGCRDFADPSLPLFQSRQQAWLGGMCRVEGGPALSLGTVAHLPTPPDTQGEVALADAQYMALQITTVFEGGKSMNYQALADDFDGQATSFGLIQWNFGQGTLGPLLKKMLAKDAAGFSGCFGADADYDTLKSALDNNSSTDQAQWARDLLASSKGRKAWRAAFESLGKVQAFNVIQQEEAAAKYHPKVVGCLAKLRELAPELMKSVAFRSYAALFDLCVQQNNLDKAWEQIKAEVKNQNPTTQVELLRIAVTERAEKASAQWVSDCLSRRLGILEGRAVESTHDKVTKKRQNDQYTLLSEHGSKKVLDL